MKRSILKLTALGLMVSALSACVVAPAGAGYGRGGQGHAHGHGHGHGHGGDGAHRR